MSRSSDRGQTEPLAALVAVAVVSLALGSYAGVLGTSLPGPSDRHVEETALLAVEDRVAPAGVVRPSLVSGGPDAGPSGYETNVSVTVGEHRWTAGPHVPSTVNRTTEQIGVRVAPARVLPGRLGVVGW
jgi:hypothetical protein